MKLGTLFLRLTLERRACAATCEQAGLRVVILS